MTRWKVRMYGITWDDGHGEYDVSGLPRNVETTVEEETKVEAFRAALNAAAELYSCRIDATQQIEATRV